MISSILLIDEHVVEILPFSFDFLIFALPSHSMVPLTAFGLAANIVAFIEFGVELATAACEVYKFKEGTTKVRSFIFITITYSSMLVVYSIYVFVQNVFLLFSTLC